MNDTKSNDYSKTDEDSDLKPRRQPYNRHEEKNSWLEEYEEDTKALFEELDAFYDDEGNLI